jgi:Fur family ferric uptake transcriptional regulator
MRNATDALVCLQENGYRITTTRQAVNDVLYRLKGPFTIEELSDALPGIGRATAFRTVRLFQDLGIICRVNLEDGSARYQLASTGEHHHHFICTECGVVTEFIDAHIDQAVNRQAQGANFELNAHTIDLYGIGSCCSKKCSTNS